MQDLNIEHIKKLWILELIVQSGSLKKAALKAKVSPSAISQTLSALEKTMGRPLVIRGRGSVTPTPDALEALEMVRPAFEVCRKLQSPKSTKIPKLSWLDFGAYESLAIDVLPLLLHSLREKMPNTRLRLQVSRTSSLLTKIRKGELFAALVPEVDSMGRMYVKDVVEERLGVYIARSNPLISKLGWDALKSHGLASLSPGKDGLPRYYMKFLKQLGSQNKPNLLSDSFESIRALASAGSMAAVLPQRVAKRHDDLVEIFPPGNRPYKERGYHRICMVASASCNQGEIDFLAAECRRVFGEWGN